MEKFKYTVSLECTLLAEPFLTVHMLCTEKRLCTNPVKFLLSMLSALLSNSFEPMPNRCSFLKVSFRRTFRRHFYLLPAGSVSIIGFSQKLMLALEKPVWREQTGMTSPRTGATATLKDGLDLCRAYFFRVWRKEIKEALLAGWLEWSHFECSESVSFSLSKAFQQNCLFKFFHSFPFFCLCSPRLFYVFCH